MTLCRPNRAALVQKIPPLLFLAATPYGSCAKPDRDGTHDQRSRLAASRTSTFGMHLTAPDTGAIAVNVFAERNGTRVDRQALLKLIDRSTQRAVWTTTDDRAQACIHQHCLRNI